MCDEDIAGQGNRRQISMAPSRRTIGDFLSAEELENLTIRAGTLTAAERQIINHHIEVTIDMLNHCRGQGT